jgi:hypothetical protein
MSLHRSALAALLSLALLAACDEISSEDDPRSRGAFVEKIDAEPPPPDAEPPGTCSGIPVLCSYRTVEQCETGSGCELENACHSPNLQRCLAYDDADDCIADSACRWSSGSDWCFVASSFCPFEPTELQCAQTDRGSCDWGPVCDGSATYCFMIDDRASCEDQLGCEWELQ